MSTTMILAPIIMANWPAISAAAVGAAAALGLTLKQEVDLLMKDHQDQQAVEQRQAEVTVDRAEVTESLRQGQEMVFGKGDIQIRVGRDAQGRCTVCASGANHSQEHLRKIAEEFAEKLTQVFVYNRVMTELKRKGFRLVDQEIMDDQSIRLHVRRWVD